MSYLRHVEACNCFDPDASLPFLLGGRRPALFVVITPRRWRASPPCSGSTTGDPPGQETLDTPQRRTEALAEVCRSLVRMGALAAIRREAFAITQGWLGPLLFELDRGAVPFFGTRSYGVHLNGFRRDGDRLMMWIGRRALDKKIAPGKLDNLVAGGISSGYDAQETLIKEAGEEAGMAVALARRAWPVGAMLYRMALPDGMRDDVLFSYDLELPGDFVPRNTDGEISGFELLPFAECLRLVPDR